ncbi:MAG: BON domain-containing protein [Terriglobia bacterium]|jgi:hyperosmotically inducible protein
MRNKLPLLALSLVLGAGWVWAGPPTTDSQAIENIQLRLDKAKVDQHGDVQVTYAGGVATLTGTMDNLGSKLDAEKAAQKVRGVTQVVDNIQVRAEGVEDQQILERARHEIVMYYAYGIFDNVELAAHNGTLAVSGQVTQPFKKTDMGNILERVKGVAALQNDLEVLPVSNFDDRLRQQVARAIYGDPFFIRYANQALPPIHIIVKNGNVTLEGVVASTMDRTKAEMAALHAGLSFAVVDNLQIEKS